MYSSSSGRSPDRARLGFGLETGHSWGGYFRSRSVKRPVCQGELYVERLARDRYGTVNAKGHG